MKKEDAETVEKEFQESIITHFPPFFCLLYYGWLKDDQLSERVEKQQGAEPYLL